MAKGMLGFGTLRRRFLAPLLIVSFVCCWGPGSQVQGANPPESSSALLAAPGGWRDILPGADLQGWYRVVIPPGGKLGPQQWHVDVAQKLLICDGDGGHDMLLFGQEVADAIFHFEFRYTKVEGKSGYNSGAYIRNSSDGSVWHQAQFGDARGGYLFGATPSAGGTNRFTLKGEVQDGRVKPAGQWNTMELTARGKTLTLWVNGAVTCRFEDCGMPKGHVGLEAEGYRIQFRNLKLKLLDGAAPSTKRRQVSRG